MTDLHSRVTVEMINFMKVESSVGGLGLHTMITALESTFNLATRHVN